MLAIPVLQAFVAPPPPNPLTGLPPPKLIPAHRYACSSVQQADTVSRGSGGGRERAEKILGLLARRQKLLLLAYWLLLLVL